jgi:predicted kinase
VRATDRRRPGEVVPRPGSAGEQTTDSTDCARIPAAVVVSGPPASGKTTLATALAAALHYAIMDLDTVTGPVTRAALRTAVGDETAIDSPAGVALRAPRYESLLDAAAANLAVGIGVVIAAPFTVERASPERFEQVVRRLRSDVALLYIDAPEEVVRARLERRNAARDRAKLTPAPARTTRTALVPEAIVIDGTVALDAQLGEALDGLARLQHRRSNKPEAASC